MIDSSPNILTFLLRLRTPVSYSHAHESSMTQSIISMDKENDSSSDTYSKAKSIEYVKLPNTTKSSFSLKNNECDVTP